MSRTHRHLTITGLAQTAETRTELFEGREHLAVPVIALIGDSVVWASNAPGPEFIPSDVIARSAIEWAGRPVVGDHPIVNGQAVSANDPRICESRAFGRIANPTYGLDKKLRLEAWLDKTKAPKVGELESDVLTRINKGETVEVSIGAFVEIEKQEGTSPNGQDYVGVWTDIGSDHLAMLPAGVGGACSVDMGCGAPRINNAISSNGGNNMPESAQPKQSKLQESVPLNLFQRMMAAVGLFRTAQEDGESDNEVRSALHVALYNIEPGFNWIEDVFHETSKVVYSTYTEGETHYWRRTFAINGDGTATVNDDRTAVRRVGTWEDIVTEETETAGGEPEVRATSSCGCARMTNNTSDTTTNPEREGESMPTNVNSNTKSGHIDKLIALKMFAEDDRKTLEALSEDRLKALSDNATSTETTTPTPAKETKSASTETTTAEVKESPLTEQQWLEQAPESVRELVNRYQREEEEYRTSLVATLSKAQTAFSVDRLKAMSTDDLKALSVVTKVDTPVVTRDYVGRGASAVRTQRDFTPPDPYNLNGNSNTQAATDKAAAN